MAIYNIHELERTRITKSMSLGDSIINEAKKRTSFDIFLSHSFLDSKIVEGLFYELTSLGYSVYVDWIIDTHLDRKNITKSSAELIRMRMNQSKCLLLAVSENSDLSKWIPWELGYVDGKTHKCAILPISKDMNPKDVYHRSEYLKLYPYIYNKKMFLESKKEIYVVDSAEEYSTLNEYIFESKKPFLRSTKLF